MLRKLSNKWYLLKITGLRHIENEGKGEEEEWEHKIKQYQLNKILFNILNDWTKIDRIQINFR